MSINIILDKSTFQSLNYNELIGINNYYEHNITPILVMEILGDLKKEGSPGKPPPKARVIDFARKLFPLNSVVNAHFKTLLKGDLLSHKVEIDGRPVLDVEKAVQTKEGQKGWLMQETSEEKSIQKWKQGFFEEADYELSKLWRDSTTSKDSLEGLKNALSSSKLNIPITNFEQLGNHVADILSTEAIQDRLLSGLMINFDLTPAEGAIAFDRWLKAGRPSIKDFAPFAFHCFRVDLLFYIGLQHDLISTRPTNSLDKQYFYYIPFCDVFVSNDNFHIDLAPLLIRENQVFINGSDLKQDLKYINEHLSSIPEPERVQFLKKPPILTESFTYKVWNRFLDYPNKKPWDREISKEENEWAISKMKEFEESTHSSEAPKFEDGEEPNYVLRKTWLQKNDPCFCGSGKRVIDCCIPEAEFNKIAIEEMKRQMERGEV